MIKKIEHIGIATEASDVTVFEDILGVKPHGKQEVKDQEVITSFFAVGESEIELLAPSSTDGIIAKFIKKKGKGFHHIALLVDDIESEMTRISNKGYRFLYPKPMQGANNKQINFIHPKDSCGLLIELCQDTEE